MIDAYHSNAVLKVKASGILANICLACQAFGWFGIGYACLALASAIFKGALQ